MGAVISRVLTAKVDSIYQHWNTECDSQRDIIAAGITNRKAHNENHDTREGSKHEEITSVRRTIAGGIFQTRQVASYFGTHFQRLFVLLSPWSVKDFFKRLWTKFSYGGVSTTERSKAGKGTSLAESATHYFIRRGFWTSHENGVSQLPSESGESVQAPRSHENNNRSRVSQLENKLKNAAIEKANLLRELEDAHKVVNEMKDVHACDQLRIRDLWNIVSIARGIGHAFHNDMAPVKKQTDQLLNEYDDKMATMSTERDVYRRQVKEAEDQIRALNASIAAKDSNLSKAAAREAALQKKLASVESELQDALKKLVSAANEEVRSNVTGHAAETPSTRFPTATDTAILHSLYRDALARSTTLEAQNLKLRDSLAALTQSRANGPSPRDGQQRPRSPPSPISAPPTQLIVIGVDLGSGAQDHLPSIKAVYRTLVHYISLNHSLALVSTVAHGCRGSHEVAVSAWERPHRLALDTLEDVPAGGASDHERCLASAYNNLVADRALFESLRKVVVLVGHAMDPVPAKSLRATCRRFKAQDIQLHSVVVGCVEKAEREGLAISWIAKQVGGRGLSESTYLAALPEILPHDE
ncbi:hypothetical protein F5X96DRAFT_687870 [Biscogniauxia mediterranea]|nr:hypothetical protein F5X96DRAFT_687870 [Biscogniauxia mediterranea]